MTTATHTPTLEEHIEAHTEMLRIAAIAHDAALNRKHQMHKLVGICHDRFCDYRHIYIDERSEWAAFAKAEVK